MNTIFLIGSHQYQMVAHDEDWMCEGAFNTEQEAIDACKDHEFIVEVAVGERLPALVSDAIKIYWPKHETWESSVLYKQRQEGAG